MYKHTTRFYFILSETIASDLMHDCIGSDRDRFGPWFPPSGIILFCHLQLHHHPYLRFLSLDPDGYMKKKRVSSSSSRMLSTMIHYP